MVLFPFHVPIYVPTALVQAVFSTLCRLRVISPAHGGTWAAQDEPAPRGAGRAPRPTPRLTRLRLPMNFMTAPLIADLFLLAIVAIGREEVRSGTVGSNHIQPIDIMVFFISLAYIAISIDASGLIRYLAFRVLKWGGEVGHRLFLYLYAFFFLLGSFIGNDPIILSGTAFLAYMTRVSNNIEHPRAWIHTQFAVANIASAVLVSSNPTNLVLAGAFNIRFIDYTANMVVPVVVTAIVLFPFLLYIIFAHERLIPIKITMHELPDEMKKKKPVNPNIPHARGNAEDPGGDGSDDEQGRLLSLEEIMNPFLDRWGAGFGAIIMAVTLVTVLAVNAVSQSLGEIPVFYVTLPAASVMFCWDVAFGWVHREETREIARRGRQEVETARAERLMRREAARHGDDGPRRGGGGVLSGDADSPSSPSPPPPPAVLVEDDEPRDDGASRSGDGNADDAKRVETAEIRPEDRRPTGKPGPTAAGPASPAPAPPPAGEPRGSAGGPSDSEGKEPPPEGPHDGDVEPAAGGALTPAREEPRTLASAAGDARRWCQETFPTVAAVLAHLPLALVPFALSMFVLVEALVTKGWVPVFAYGWDHWVEKTGTVGAVGGMGFLSVVLCNVSTTGALSLPPSPSPPPPPPPMTNPSPPPAWTAHIDRAR